MKTQPRRNFQKIVPYLPLDADTFNFSVFVSWLEKQSPYRMVDGSRTNLAEMLAQIAVSIADEGQANLELMATGVDLTARPSSTTLNALVSPT